MRRDQVNVFRALSDPNRLRIMKMLGERELCVCEIKHVLDLSVSTVSKHLSILRDAGLITDAKDGKWVNYRLAASPENKLARSMMKVLQQSFEDEATVQADRKQVRKVDRNTICKLQ